MPQNDIAELRTFNRFYTNHLGWLDRTILTGSLTLTEARVLFEIHLHQPCTARDLLGILQLDKGYLSRTLDAFERRGFIQRKPSTQDGRYLRILLQPKGRREFNKINKASEDQIRELLNGISPTARKKLVRHTRSILTILQHHPHGKN
jgi:DNA-binding MarR family transcriptional regulator